MNDNNDEPEQETLLEELPEAAEQTPEATPEAEPDVEPELTPEPEPAALLPAEEEPQAAPDMAPRLPELEEAEASPLMPAKEPEDEPEQETPSQSPSPEPPENMEQKKREYWRKVLTGNPFTVPKEVKRRSGAYDVDFTEDQREYHLLSTINKSWAADHLPHTREEINTMWPQKRKELTQQFGVQDNEHELFLALSEEEQNAPRREAATNVYNACFMAGLDDKKQTNIGRWIADLSPEDTQHAHELAHAAYMQGQQRRGQLYGLAQRLAHGMETFESMEEDAIAAPRVLGAAPDLLSSIDELADLEETDANTALYLASEIVKKEHKGEETPGLLTRAQQAVRRGVTNMGSGMLQAVSHLGITTLSRLGEKVESDRMKQMAGAWDKRMQMLQKIRKLSQEELRPLVLPEETHGAASYLITAAEAAPSAVLSCCGGAGFSALTLGAVGESVAEARERAPMASQELQLYAGLLAGAIQAGIYMNLNRVGGKLLEQSISRIGRASGQGVAGYTLAGLNIMGGATTEAAKLLAAGKLAGAVDLGAQEMAARLSKTASNINWEEFGNNLTDVEANLHEAASLLPFLLIGSGRLALQHFRSPRAILGEGELLKDWGIPEEKRQAILNEQDLGAQSSMLREAITGSKMWSGAGFMPEAWRALRLLHSDSFQEFGQVKKVCDFLKLPVPDPNTPAETPAASQPPLDPSKAGSKKIALAMNMWNQWWSKAQVDRAPATYPTAEAPGEGYTSVADHSIRAYNALAFGKMDSQVPRRMGELGVYAPQAEGERMLLLRDRVADLERLSYQFLMNVYSVDALAQDYRGADLWKSKTERTRKCILGAVGRAVVSTARGASREQAVEELYQYVTGFLTRRKYQGIRTNWLKKARSRDIAKLTEKSDNYLMTQQKERPEMMDAMRLVSGLRAGVDALIDVIPLTADFQTALTRGLSPAEAYVYILNREFNLPDNQLRPDTVKLGKDINNITPMKEYSKENAEQFEIYRKLTGTSIEHAEGDDAVTYSRALRPDGTMTHWHAEDGHVINDIAGNAALRFMPFGHADNMLSMHIGSGEHVNLRNRHAAADGVFSTYDQLCNLAKKDLGDYWQGRATIAMPGMKVERVRRFFRIAQDKDGVTPLIFKEDTSGEHYKVDTYSEVTPLSMAQSRFYIYWQRMLNSGFVSPNDMADFLVSKNIISEAEKKTILTPSRAHYNYLRRDNPNPRPKIAEYRATLVSHSLSQKMAEYSTLRFLAELPKLPMPPTVKEWVGMAAFCPETEPSAAKVRSIKVQGDGKGIVSWANKTVAKKIRSMAAQVEEMRNGLAAEAESDPFMESLVNDSMGLDMLRRCERGWVAHTAGAMTALSAPQSLWNMLRAPRRTWSRMDEIQQAPYREHLLRFCSKEAYLAPEKAGQDPVDHAIELLDELLYTYPEMHLYSCVPGQPHLLRKIDFTAEPEEPAAPGAPVFEPEPIYEWDGKVKQDFKVLEAQPVPESMEADSRVMLGIALLDSLRDCFSHLPHAYNDGIWWNSQLYGLGGASPVDIEEFYVQRPLEPLLGVLEAISRIEADKGAFSVCGTKIRGLDSRLNLRPLQAITIYRAKDDSRQVCRLMPGDPIMQRPTMAQPYVVQTKGGIYLHKGKPVLKPERLEEVYTPLHKFNSSGRSLYKPRSSGYLEKTCRHNLEQALNYCAEAISPEDELSHSNYMLEYLMRLTEDSNFSANLVGVDPSTLSVGQARLLSLAREMLACVCSINPEESYGRVAEMADEIRKNPKLMNSILDTLNMTNYTDMSPYFDTMHTMEKALNRELWKAEREKMKRRRKANPATPQPLP